MANYTDDLDGNSAGAGVPTGWTKRTALTAETASKADAGGGDIYFRLSMSSSNRYPYSLDAINSDGDRDDCEILARVRTSGTSSVNLVGVCLRVTDGDGLYAANITGSEFRIQRVVGGSGSSLALTSGKGLSANTWYWIRFRANGSAGNFLKAKIWADGGSEPGTWDLEIGDGTPITTVGYAGFIAHSNDGNHDLAEIAIATNGDTATFGGGGGGGAPAKAFRIIHG